MTYFPAKPPPSAASPLGDADTTGVMQGGIPKTATLSLMKAYLTGSTGSAGGMAGTGLYQARAGKIYDPSGNAAYLAGVNVPDWAATGYGAVGDQGDGTDQGLFLMQLLPDTKIVRVSCARNAVGYFDTFVSNLTGRGVVVVLEDHDTTKGASWVLSDSLAWYQAQAAHYKGNARVWFGTVNEPNFDNQANADTSISNMQVIYNQVRAAGNGNPIGLGLNDNTQLLTGRQSYFSGMSNVFWDMHVYNWIVNYSADQATCDNWVSATFASLTGGYGITSADGAIPVQMGEFGTSTDGSIVDAGGTQMVVAAFKAACTGGTAWDWKAGTADLIQTRGVLTSYGQVVKQWMAGSPPAAWTDTDGS